MPVHFCRTAGKSVSEAVKNRFRTIALQEKEQSLRRVFLLQKGMGEMV